jgi:Skp family chaperone for outer membrane proteins
MRTLAAVVAGAVVGSAVLAGGRALASLPEDAATAPSCRVAFVDVGKALQAHPRLKAHEEKLRAEADALAEGIARRKQELRKDSQEVEARLTPGTPAYESAWRIVELKNYEIQLDEKLGQEGLKRRAVVTMAQVYREVCSEAERIASERGYACVLSVESDPLVVEDKGMVMTRDALRLAIRTRTAIWAREDVDLTQAVIDALAAAAAPAGGEPEKEGERREGERK